MNPLYRIKMECADGLLNPGEYMHQLTSHTTELTADGLRRTAYFRFLDCTMNLKVEILGEEDPELGVIKYTPVFSNSSKSTVRILQLDAGVALPKQEAVLHYYTSDWGSEFVPMQKKLEGEFLFGSTSGRSSKGFDPWAGLSTGDGFTAAALAWSGNWTCMVSYEEASLCLSMGLSTDGFFTDVEPGGSFTGAGVYVACGADEEEACLRLRRYFRRRLSMAGRLAELPLEYNTWWAYEDKCISEDVYQENAELAKELGCSYAMMDAGWFGGNEDGQSWVDKRGDWDVVNPRDFPSGMKSMCDRAKAAGMLPGMWCEIEAVGPLARLNETHPELLARRDGESLGYVCFGSEKTRRWAMETADKIAGEYGAKWIKFDFNLDPGKGCSDLSHGHGAGDGLYAHYMGYYQFLDELHRKYPDVVIENCSSGGLRMDIEMLSHTHWTHLSDPDYTEFHLQLYWGALSYLHQCACLHFSWSQVMFCDHNLQIHNPLSADMPRHRFDYMIRAVLMGVPGFSYRLPELPDWCRERLKEHMQFYKEIASSYIQDGDAYRLTRQPLAGGKGERWPAFLFVSSAGDGVLFAFRLEYAAEEADVRLLGLEGDAVYKVRFTDSGACFERTGSELMQVGLHFAGIPEEGSEIVRLHRV